MARPPEYTIEKTRGDTLEFDITVWNYRYALAACLIWLTLKMSLADPDAPTLQATLAAGEIVILYDDVLTTQGLTNAGATLINFAGPLTIDLPVGTVLGFEADVATLTEAASIGQTFVNVVPLKSAIPGGSTARVGLLRATFPPSATAGFLEDTTLVGDVQIKYPSGHVHTLARISTTVYRDATLATI